MKADDRSVPNTKDMFSKERLDRYLKTVWAGRISCFFEEVDSTNEEARRLIQKGAGHGMLVAAGKQTAGKGRRGNSFSSPAGCGIWMTLLLRREADNDRVSMLTLLMGMAVQKAICNLTDLEPQIKWPNDIVLNGKKICGILTELVIQAEGEDYILIGTGINVHNRNFPAELTRCATSLFLEGAQDVDRSALAAEVLYQFEQYYEKFMLSQDMSELAQEYHACLINKNHEVIVHDPKGSYRGTALGINDRGELLVRTQETVRCVSAGEVSVRGVYGYV